MSIVADNGNTVRDTSDTGDTMEDLEGKAF